MVLKFSFFFSSSSSSLINWARGLLGEVILSQIFSEFVCGWSFHHYDRRTSLSLLLLTRTSLPWTGSLAWKWCHLLTNHMAVKEDMAAVCIRSLYTRHPYILFHFYEMILHLSIEVSWESLQWYKTFQTSRTTPLSLLKFPLIMLYAT